MQHQHNPGMGNHSEDIELKVDVELFDNLPLQLTGVLSPETKHYLTQPTTRREASNTPRVLTDLEGLDFFQKFSNTTKSKLCKKLFYESFHHNEFLLRQGEEVQALYVLLTGVVTIRYNILTPTAESGTETQWPERILRSGDYFGHVDLLRRRSSTVDAYSVGYSEVLALKLEDFSVVRSSLKPDQTRLRKFIHSTQILRKFKWSDEELSVLEMFSKLVSCSEAVQMYDSCRGTSSRWSYFLVAGECRLTREVSYTVLDPGTVNMRFKAIEAGQGAQKIMKKDLEFETIQRGFFFGVGEDFGSNRVLSNPASEYLLVLRLVMFFKNRKILKEMADCLTASLPADQVLLDDFLKHKRASKEVKDMVREMLEDKPVRLADA